MMHPAQENAQALVPSPPLLHPTQLTPPSIGWGNPQQTKQKQKQLFFLNWKVVLFLFCKMDFLPQMRLLSQHPSAPESTRISALKAIAAAFRGLGGLPGVDDVDRKGSGSTDVPIAGSGGSGQGDSADGPVLGPDAFLEQLGHSALLLDGRVGPKDQPDEVQTETVDCIAAVLERFPPVCAEVRRGLPFPFSAAPVLGWPHSPTTWTIASE
jgi:hypothetical protein